MTTQINFVCWTSADVTATIPTEAATPSAEVLLATHAPLRITRRGAMGGHAETEIVDEQQVLNEFLTNEPTNGVLVAPVLGESGTGKSHLVRWVEAKLDADAPGRRIIYLRKTDTNLKHVVEQLLVGQKGPKFEEIRTKLDSLGSGITQETMEGRILDSLAEALEQHETSGPAKALVGPNGLAVFFHDPLFRKHLRRDGSFVQRRAQHALYGRNADEPDIPLEFTADQLPLDIVDFANIADAAAATRKIFTRLTANPQLQADAVAMINDLLHVAITRAVGLSVGDVAQAFLQMRANLVDDEIILLIEDVALIQGVRRDLLDAIVEPGVDKGVRKYATIRTMMAVTTGYYNEILPETFRYRADATGPRFIIDLDLASEAADEGLFVDFVGRYLNAARVGRDKLENAAPQVLNACAKCDFRPACHENFGESSDGYGLYPYNRPAIMRAIKTLADRTDNTRTFNPRRVLARAVRDTLGDNQSLITSGQFPPSDFLTGPGQAGLPALSMGVRARIEELYGEADSGRLQTLLTFWGDSGRTPILPGVLTAFSHDPIPAFVDDERGPDPAPGPDPQTLPPAVVAKLDSIEKWSTGSANLAPALAGELRGTVREALLARLDWFDPVIKDPDSGALKKALPNNAAGVSIEGATENIQNTNPVIVVPRNARMGQMFSGLVLLNARFPERAGEALPRLDALVAPAVDELRQRIVGVLEIDDASLIEAAASLLSGAAYCGRVPSAPKDVDLLNALLWSDTSHVRADAAVRRPDWMAAYSNYVNARVAVVERFLAGSGAAQGINGGVHVLDVNRLVPLAQVAWKKAKAGGTPILPAWCKSFDLQANALRRAAVPQIAHWQGLVDRVRVHMPHGVSYVETVDAIIEATNAGGDLGLVKVNNLTQVPGINAAARELDASSIVSVERLLAAIESAEGEARLALVGNEVGADLDRIVEFLESSAEWVTAGLAQAETEGDAATDLDASLADAVATWFEIVNEFKDDCSESPKSNGSDQDEEVQ
ncbi:protein DpdH [Kribbella catacumbae]|uniref:protein DpdH n=1 Tax=Kribbella catacumbae TaxID=460086 RepID=UPI00036584E8|nr:protein DpdH [Kribbella catacumbae]